MCLRLVVVNTKDQTAYLGSDSGCLIVNEGQLKAVGKSQTELSIEDIKDCLLSIEEIGAKIIRIDQFTAIAYTSWKTPYFGYVEELIRSGYRSPLHFLNVDDFYFFWVQYNGRGLEVYDVGADRDSGVNNRKDVCVRAVNPLFKTKFKTVCYSYGVFGGSDIEEKLHGFLSEYTPVFYFKGDSEIKSALLDVYGKLKSINPLLGRELYVLKVSSGGCMWV